MGSYARPVQLKVFVDKEKKKVMFAEAEADFVEILFSFLTLPLGTIERLSRKHPDSNNMEVGSLASLYQGVVNLDDKHFRSRKDVLVNPKNSSDFLCQKLRVDLNDSKPIAACLSGIHGHVVFLKKNASFIITDDLNVVPFMLDTSVELLNSLGVGCINLLDNRTMNFGLKEFSNLLKWSLLTNNPLTNLVLGGSKPCSSFTNSLLSHSPLPSTNSTQSETVKLLIDKSKKKVICAQVEKFFVELLFSFLTIPLGTVQHLTNGSSSPVAISSLYKSISSLGDGKYLKYEDTKAMLLRPKLAVDYRRVTEFLPIYEAITPTGSFIKEQATFIVSDNLEVALPPSVSTVSKFNTLGIPVGDMEVREVSVGEQEALLLLKACLTSSSALTECFYAFSKKAECFYEFSKKQKAEP